MKISIIGAGYVGLSNAMLLAQNNEVTIYDTNEKKIKQLNQRVSPIIDADIELFLANKDLNFKATLNKEITFKGADYVIICTPTNYDAVTNYFDTSSVEQVINDAISLNPLATIVIKSTVPVGYTEKIKNKLLNFQEMLMN